MPDLCPHGEEKRNRMWDHMTAWAGPIGVCRCCTTQYGFIDSGVMTSSYSEITAHDRDLCTACGGKSRSIRTEHNTGKEPA